MSLFSRFLFPRQRRSLSSAPSSPARPLARRRYERVLKFEPMEERALLSVSVGGSGYDSAVYAANQSTASTTPSAMISIPAATRADVVPDTLRHLAYITTTDGDLLRYDLNARAFLSPIHLGGKLAGADISPDQNTLVVADGTQTETNNWIHVVDLTTGTSRKITFPLAFYERGTYSVAFLDNSTVLVTSEFHGSGGQLPLRQVNLNSGTATIIRNVGQNTMLSESADHSVVGYAEGNSSRGLLGRYRTSDGNTLTASLGRGVFEIAVSRNGEQYVLPTSTGAYFLDENLTQVEKINVSPDDLLSTAAVYSPISNRVYLAWASWGTGSGLIDTYDTNTLTRAAVIDSKAFVRSPGLWAFRDGRLNISSDGSLLFATVDGGVNVYDVSTPRLTLSSPQYANATTAVATVTANSPLETLANGTTVLLDVDLNHDGDFADQGEAAYATSKLTGGTATFSWAGVLPDGAYSLQARLSDSLGHEGASAAVSSTLDTTPPSITVGMEAAFIDGGPTRTYLVKYADTNFDSSTLSASDVNLICTGTANAKVTVTPQSMSGTGGRVWVTLSDFSGTGTISFSIVAGTARDKAGNPAPASAATEAFQVTAPFESVGSLGLPSVTEGAMAWGDYDRDGRLDVAISGKDANGNLIAKIYHNDGKDAFHDIGAGLTGVHDSSLAWGDYDGDGRLDLALCGWTADDTITKIYHNDGNGAFRDIQASLAGVGSGSATWGDYDNDGLLDLLVAGTDSSKVPDQPVFGLSYGTCKLYHNEGNGTFRDAGGYGRITQGEVAWGDYDNDGRLDYVATGWDGPIPPRTTLFHNEGNGSFRAVESVFSVFGHGSVDWGDYDNDGRLDLVFTGLRGGTVPATVVYHNDGKGLFHEANIQLVGVSNGSAKWGDYDNDGRLDLFVNGVDASGNWVTKIYHNDGSNLLGATLFHDAMPDLPGLRFSTAAWADYDGKGHLSLVLTGQQADGSVVTNVYRPLVTTPELPPVAPKNLSTYTDKTSATLKWQTPDWWSSGIWAAVYPPPWSTIPAPGFSYNIRIGTTPGGCDILNPEVDFAGRSLLPQRGMIQATSWTIEGLTPGKTYYWSVQAVDANFDVSAFAAERCFTIPSNLPSFQLDPPAAAEYAIGEPIPISWTAGNVPDGSKISLCYDEDRIWWNGNEHWIEIDQVAAADGKGSYNWQPQHLGAGTYYVAGYLWADGRPTFSRIGQPIKITGQLPTFNLVSSRSVTVTAGQPVSINWNANYVGAGSKVSLCYDTDKRWNGNEHWIEIDQVAAVNGNASYTWDTTGVAAGTYYVGGYLWSGATPFFSHAAQPINVIVASASFKLTGPAPAHGQSEFVLVEWTANNIAPGSKISLCYDEDQIWWNGNEHWIEIDQVAASNGVGTYRWNTSGLRAGNYYLAGYLWSDGRPTFSHMTQPITVTNRPAGEISSNSLLSLDAAFAMLGTG